MDVMNCSHNRANVYAQGYRFIVVSHGRIRGAYYVYSAALRSLKRRKLTGFACAVYAWEA